MTQPLDLDEYEQLIARTTPVGAATAAPGMAAAMAAEIRRLRARLWELERPSTEAERNALRQSFTELAAQASEDGEHEDAFNLECQLREREEQWKAEDAAAASALARP